jgi:hypothetical protein
VKRADVSIEDLGGVLRIRAHSAAGRAFLNTLPSPGLCEDIGAVGELLIDESEMPEKLPLPVCTWRLHSRR